MLRRWLITILLLVAVGSAAPMAAEDPWGYELADQMMSPYCPGRALSECPSPQAGELRAWILEEEKAGATRESVEEELYRIFGDGLRQTPKAEGLGLLAYLLPAGLFLLGGAVVVIYLRRLSGSGTAPAGRMPGSGVGPTSGAMRDQEGPLAASPDVDLEAEIEAEVDAAIEVEMREGAT